MRGYKPNPDCNGCGTGWSAKLVPDTIYGLNITDICCPHDDWYERGLTQEEKEQADTELLLNLLDRIDSYNKWYYPTKLARLRAMDYYSAVRDHGYDAFFTEKDYGEATYN